MLVVLRLAWPSQLRITVTSTPSVTRLDAVAWRKVWGEIRFLANDGANLVAAVTYCFNLKRTPAALRGSVPVDKNGFIFPARPPFQESLQEFNRLGPERTGPLFSPFAEQSNVEG